MSTTDKLENMNTKNESLQTQVPERDCAVCLQKCHYPTQLPCGHIFCFLCVKGVARQSKKCAMCRAEIPPDYLDNPVILEMITREEIASTQSSEGYQWYYEGRNGWWKYDEISNNDLEAAFNAQDAQCKLLLAGALYCIDFQSMMQMQSRDPTKRRRVRRDVPTLPSKGIAGIKIIDNTQTKNESDENVTNNVNQTDENLTNDVNQTDENITNDVNQSDENVTNAVNQTDENVRNDVNQTDEVVEIVDVSTDSIPTEETAYASTEDNASVSTEDNASASTEDNTLGDIMQRISSIDLQEMVQENAPPIRDSSEVEDT